MTCNYCNRPPVANYQKVWVRWNITHGCEYADKPDYDGAYQLNKWDEPTGEDNVHVCETHEEPFLNGDL